MTHGIYKYRKDFDMCHHFKSDTHKVAGLYVLFPIPDYL